MRGELGLSAHLHSPRPGAIPAFGCPRAISSRSNSANPPRTVSINRPCAVVVSAHVSPRDRNPALRSVIAARVLSRSRVDRASGQGASPAARHRLRAWLRPSGAGRDRSGLRSPLRGTPSYIRPWSVAVPARQRSAFTTPCAIRDRDARDNFAAAHFNRWLGPALSAVTRARLGRRRCLGCALALGDPLPGSDPPLS
jgi:hypothetical protein